MTTFTPDIAAQLRGPEWMRDRRAAALDRFDDIGLPTEAEEIWRYSRISQLDLDQYAPVDGDGERGVPSGADAGIDAVGPRTGLLVTRNGRVSHVELDPVLQERGVVVGDVLDGDDGDDRIGSVAASSTDAFTELATAFMTGGALVRVPACAPTLVSRVGAAAAASGPCISAPARACTTSARCRITPHPRPPATCCSRGQ